MTDADAQATALSIDGIGAYDHVLRSAMMEKVHSVPGLRGLLPFVRTTYVKPTRYVWEDGDGVKHQIHQAEGGEQGDPLMPLLFCLAIHDALANVQSRLRPREYIFAFLDDVYAVTSPGGSRAVYNLLAEQLWAVAGVRLHTGKIRVWNRAAERLPDMDDLGNEVWNPEGIKILGTPVGSPQFVQGAIHTRLEDEAKLWDAISWVPDLQSSWQILLQCAGPRCHHPLRTLPPSQSAHYAAEHDEGMQRTMRALLGDIPGGDQEKMRPDWPHSPCAWVVWVSDLRFAWHQLPIGRHGQTRCPCCRSGSQLLPRMP